MISAEETYETSYLLRKDQFTFAFGDIIFQLVGRGVCSVPPFNSFFCFFPWYLFLFREETDFSTEVPSLFSPAGEGAEKKKKVLTENKPT
jgi:hypothetical protein